MVIRGDKVVGVYDEFVDALETVAETGGGEIYRVEFIARLTEEEAHALKETLLTSTIEPVEAPVKREAKPAIVLDRGYSRDHALELSKHFPNTRIVLLSTNIEAEEKIDNIRIIPAKNELDVKDVLDELIAQGYKVVFFTNDKKLYTHLAVSGKVSVYYKPVTNYQNDLELIDSIIGDIKRSLEAGK